MMKDFLDKFTEYCKKPEVDSNKANAYSKAIEYLCIYLQISEIDFHAVDKIRSIEEDICNKNSSVYKDLLAFLTERRQKSYLEGGFVRAALKPFFEFVSEWIKPTKVYEWVEFYMELANKLLTYKNDRTALIQIIKNVFIKANFKLPTLEKDNNIVDVDPFTFFALFNKGIKDSNRILLLTVIKDLLEISAVVPENFDGIPVVNPMKATFYYFLGERKDEDIDNLWELFEVALKYSDNKMDCRNQFVELFDTVSKQKGISWNITMGLYWFRPYTYINLDARNRKLLENNSKRFLPNVDIVKLLKKVPSGEDYLNIITLVKEVMSEYASFPELSYDAWKQSTEDKLKFFGEEEITYWPSLEEYDPGITVEMWKDILADKTLTPDEMLDILAKMLEIGGESTCYHMAEVYGKTHNYYNAMGSNFGKRVKDRYNLPDCYDSEYDRMRYYTIPFVGRDIVEDNKTHYSWKLRDELKEALEGMDLTVNIDGANMKEFDKNIILYGPPGTGKTYNTAIYAVAIIENKSLEEVSSEDYFDVLERYNEYKKDRRIEFTTFHQSYGYEEFIEGIKPVINDKGEDNKEVAYEVLPGVFKAFCDKIERPGIKGSVDIELNEYPTVWKVSLEGTGDNPTRRECLDNDHIRVGYDECGEDATEVIENQEIGYSVLNRFINEMSIGDVVISCYTASTIDAIGVVTGEYEWHDEYEYYKRLRKVKWLVKGINENILKINNGKKLSNPTVHRVNITLSDVMDIVKKYSPEVIETDNKGNYVFIIDEINRGNISKILGELITLIEPTKRKGQPEEMQAKLPYSQKEFGVPDNVYIIGTMNTADRSIAAIDTALRRRFSFREMLPQADVLDGIEVDGISVSGMLKKMNRRIEVLYDREHTIGHAYFMPLQYDNSMECLADIFKDKIIPLLQEYFYEDYEKIRLVLGDNQKTEEYQFILKEQVDETELFGEDTDVIEDAYKYSINEKAFTAVEAYEKMI